MALCTPPSHNRSGSIKIRLTILCAKNLSKKEFFRLPDPFAKISVDGSGQCYSTETCRGTLDPKWNQHYDLYLGKGDGISISVWNRRKVSKKSSTGFLGCLKLSTSIIHRIKDTGYQRLDLTRGDEDDEHVRGQIIVSLMSRDGRGMGTPTAIVTMHGNLSSPDDLPEAWEERRTANNRIYYVNHVNRTTHWERPTQSVGTDDDEITNTNDLNSSTNNHRSSPFGNIVLTNPSASSTIPEVENNQPTNNGKRTKSPVQNQQQAPPPSNNTPSSSGNSRKHQGHAGESRRERNSARHRQYLSRNQLHQTMVLPQGYEMRTTQQGQVYYYNTRLGTSTWHDPRVPRDLGNINLDDVGPLPGGWELRATSSGRAYFLNHTRRTTQFTDPRLSNKNILNHILRSRNENRTNEGGTPNNSRLEIPSEGPPPAPPSSNDNVNNRVPSPSNRHHQQQQQPPVYTSTPSNNVDDSNNSSNITPSGLPASGLSGGGPPPITSPSEEARLRGIAETVSNAVVIQNDSTNKIPSSSSTNEELDCLPKYSRDLAAKLKSLRAELQCLQPQSGHCRLDIPRNEIFEESYKQIMKLRQKDMRKRLMVKFRAEEGLDYGGIAREWLYLLSHEMLNPYYGLFQYSREDIYTLQINADSAINPEHLSYFHFVGRVIGMAVFHGHYIDGGFTMPFYKMLLNKPIVLDDIEAVDPELHRSLTWILENDISGVIENTFVVEHDSFGHLQMKELKQGGSSIPVTEDNKKEYVRLYVLYRFMQGIERQFNSLYKGFTEVIPKDLLLSFDERELELVIGGLGQIDLEDWKKNTRLKHCNPETPVVGWFWRIVDSYSEEMRARLLQFVTGSSRVPLQGFKALQGSTGAAGPRLFTIHVVDTHLENLPKAHTCFNRIDIPLYSSYEKMLDKMTQAVEETCGFAVE